jgi:hypothetical protein
MSAKNAVGGFLVLCTTLVGAPQGLLREPVEAAGTPCTSTQSGDQQLLLVLDRDKIQPGETAVLSVVLSGSSFLRLEPYPSDALQFVVLNGPDPGHLKRYAIRAAGAGEYSILIRAGVKAQSDPAVSECMLNRSVALTVIAKEHGTLAAIAGVLTGIILGASSSLFGLYFKDFLERRATGRNQALWLSNELVGRLEAARLDLKNRRTVNYQAWMEELYSKNFSALRKWGGTPEVGETLSREVVQIEGLLRDYNQSLSKVSGDDDLVLNLDVRIVRVQRILTRAEAD